MDHEFDPQEKRERAKSDLEDLKRVMREIESEQPQETAADEPAETAAAPENDLPEQEPMESAEQEVPEAAVEAAAAAAEQEADRLADQEQAQREKILDEQAKRRHPEQPAATVQLGKSAKKGKTSAKKRKEREARRHKRHMRRVGLLAAVLLIAVVVVVSACKAISGGKNKTEQPAGSAPAQSVSGDDTVQKPQEDTRPASQQESEQYLKIKDDTSLPAYAREYPGMYADAVSAPNKESEKKVCYLTFDDGPSSTNTPGVLDVLKEKGVKGTFFVVTSSIDGNEALIKRMVDEGHTLCIHANVHEYAKLYATPEDYLKDFAAAYDRIYELTGYRVQGFRFPGGSNNAVMKRHNTYDAIVGEMTRRGFEYYDWNAYDHDAENGNYTVDQMVDYAVSEVTQSSRNDAILLMHDTYGKETTVQALGPIIDKLKAAGIDMLPITASTRPVHFEVNENTPPDMPEVSDSSDSDTDDMDDQTDSEAESE